MMVARKGKGKATPFAKPVPIVKITITAPTRALADRVDNEIVKLIGRLVLGGNVETATSTCVIPGLSIDRNDPDWRALASAVTTERVI